MSKKGKGLGNLIAGLGIGAGLGMLFAPKKGSELRCDFKKKIDELVCKAKEVDFDDVKDEFFDKVEEVKTEIEDLDKEKVLKIAKEKANVLKEKTEELVKIAKEKGTPVLENVAKEVREKATLVAKEVVKKLETKDESK